METKKKLFLFQIITNIHCRIIKTCIPKIKIVIKIRTPKDNYYVVETGNNIFERILAKIGYFSSIFIFSISNLKP